MDKRRHKKSNLLVLLLLLLVGIGIGYAFLTSNLNIKGSSDIKKAGWDVHFENLVLGSKNVTATKEAAIDENDKTTIAYTIKLNKPGDKYEFTVDVVNSGTIDAVVSAVNKTGLTEEQVKYVEYTASYSDGTDVAEEDELNVGDTKNISVSVKYKTDLNPEDLPSEDKVLSLKLEITYVQASSKSIVYPVSIYSLMQDGAYLDNTSSKYVESSTGIDFSNGSSDTNGKGIYMLSSTKNDTNPIYYYRGAVENNNVKFANFCWKIVRTTETGGIKLIYNGIPDENGACDPGEADNIGVSPFNGKDVGKPSLSYNAYVGYMYGSESATTYEETHKNTNDSAVKTKIDEWYKNNMTSYTEKLEDTVWCNDRSVMTGSFNTIYDNNDNYTGDGTGRSTTMYGALYRMANNKPSLECTNLNDKFTVSTANGNGALTYPVAMLTADELIYSGLDCGRGIPPRGKYYLASSNPVWTMSPGSFHDYDSYDDGGVHMLRVEATHSYFGADTYIMSSYIRPSISLKSGTMIVDGDGSVNDPYVVE